MLAGERFTDHPRSVCRVIAAFLRSYNDTIDDQRRQDLYRFAADVIGTRGSRATERARLACCERELAALRGDDGSRSSARLGRTVRAISPPGATQMFATLSRTLRADANGHARALALVNALVRIEVPASLPPRVPSGRTAPREHAVPDS